MTNPTLDIVSLRALAAKALENVGMKPFNDNKFTCPWLEYWNKEGFPQEKVEGILLLQDWGLDANAASDKEREGIQKSFNGMPDKEFEDTTIRNLRSIIELKNKIAQGKIVVLNAVWGCRSGESDKCGYLGKKIHVEAFPIWVEVIRFLSSGKKDFYVVFGGDWARFEKMNFADNDLEAFLKRWNKWSGKEVSLDGIKGKSYFCSHPSTWQISKTSNTDSEDIIIQDPEHWFGSLKN